MRAKVIYDLPTERQNVLDRSIGHLRAMARECGGVKAIKLNMAADLIEEALNGQG